MNLFIVSEQVYFKCIKGNFILPQPLLRERGIFSCVSTAPLFRGIPCLRNVFLWGFIFLFICKPILIQSLLCLIYDTVKSLSLERTLAFALFFSAVLHLKVFTWEHTFVLYTTIQKFVVGDCFIIIREYFRLTKAGFMFTLKKVVDLEWKNMFCVDGT